MCTDIHMGKTPIKIKNITSLLTFVVVKDHANIFTMGECRPLSKIMQFNLFKITKVSSIKKQLYTAGHGNAHAFNPRT